MKIRNTELNIWHKVHKVVMKQDEVYSIYEILNLRLIKIEIFALARMQKRNPL